LHAQELGFSEPLTAKFVVQIAAALDYLSRRCVIHRDLKLENILVCATTGRAKISDFGCAVHTIEDSRSTFCGTIEYLSPEIVKKERYDARVDLWSLGVLMYEMLFKDSPFKSTQQELTLEKIRTINFSFPDEKRMISDEAKDLIRKVSKN
jgi:serine/threonine protein kinase